MSKKSKIVKRENIPKVEHREIATVPISNRYSTYPSNGLTPVKLARILRDGDNGDLLEQSELFEEIEEKDPHLYSQMQTRKNAVTGLDYEVIPFSSDNQMDKEITEFVSDQLQSIENMEEVMLDLLDAIGKGLSVSEIIWGYDMDKIIVKEIRHKHLKNFFFDPDDQFKVRTVEHPEGILLPVNKFIIHRYKARSGHPARGGVIRVLAWMYLFKNYTVKDWVSFAEVYGMPLRLGKYDAGASTDDKEALRQALYSLGSDASGIVPTSTMIEFIESNKTSSADVYERLARYCDEQISKAVLGQTLTSDSGGGSYAQSKTHNEVRHDLTVADCKALASTMRKYLIRPLVLFNFGDDSRLPTIRFDTEEAGDQKETAEIYKTLINDVGLKISADHVYKKFGIPKPEDSEEILKPAVNPFMMKEVQPMILKDNQDLNEKLNTAVKAQKELDQLADIALEKATPAMVSNLTKVIDKLLAAESLADMKHMLEDEKELQQLLDEVDDSDLQDTLQKLMMIADLEGRGVEHG